LNQNQSILNLRIAILAFVMVAWGVAEFALHTLRPDTIQRENRIVSVFKESSDIIWNTHKSLQIKTASLASDIQRQLTDSGNATGIRNIPKSAAIENNWLLIKNSNAIWWSENLTLDVVQAMISATSVLYSSEDGVYVIASSNWSNGSDSWQLVGSTEIFRIALRGSKFGDVYEASIAQLERLQPTPFYLEGSPDLLPFDHRFSIIRVNDDYTTGHLALSTLDPDVRNYFNPSWMFGIRTFFVLLLVVLSWRILILLVSFTSALTKLFVKIGFLIFWGLSAVLLDVIAFWGGATYTGSLFNSDSIPATLVQMVWATIVFLLLCRILVNFFNTDRFFDHGTRFNRTSLILFLTGCVIGGLYWWIMIFQSEIAHFGHYFSKNPAFSGNNELFIVMCWFVLVASIYKLLEGLLHFIQKSVKYQVQWIHQVLIAGHLYLFTILFIVTYSSGSLNYFISAWILLAMPLGIWRIQHYFYSDSNERTLFRQSLILSAYPVLVAFPLSLVNNYEELYISELVNVFVGYWILSFLASVVVVLVLKLFRSDKAAFISVNFTSFFDIKSDLRQLIASGLIILIYLGTPFIADYYTRNTLENQYFNFQINQSNHHRIYGSYEPGVLQLPLFRTWTLVDQTDFETLLDYAVFFSALQNRTSNTLNWVETQESNNKILQLFKLDTVDQNAQNYRILATTVDSYTRIFGRQSAIISSISILAVLSIHFGLGIVGRHSIIKNATTQEP
jgi:hypothetical protein